MNRDIFSRHKIITWIIFLVLLIPISVIIIERELARQDRIQRENAEAERQQEREDARAEYLRREALKKADAEKQSTPKLATSQTGRTSPSSEMIPETTGVPESQTPTQENAQDVGVARYTEGLYKGMTYEEAITLWRARNDAVTDRMLENGRKQMALADALLDSSKAERSVMLSLFANLTPEQLEYARKVASETQSAEQVNVFIDDIEKFGKVKSLDQLSQEAEDILLSREAWEIADREVSVEWAGIKEERAELRRTKPTPP